MAVFAYTALKNGKDIVKGEIEATSSREARDLIRAKNLTPTKLLELNQPKEPEKKIQTKKIQKLKLREKINFTTSLNILLKTGISIIEALLFIEQNFESKRIQALSSDLRKQLLAGTSLSDAVQKYPEIFDQIDTGLIKAGEESGELEFTLSRMTELLEKQEKLISKIKGIMFYPCFIVLLAMVVTTIMLVVVFPKFKEVFTQMNIEMPLITQILINIGEFLKQYWFIIPIIFAGVGFGFYFLLKWEKSKKAIDKILLKLPVIKTFVMYLSLTNFLSVMTVAFEAGIPIVDCLLLSNMTVKNHIVQNKFKHAAVKVRQGISFSASLKAMNIIPGVIMCMISTGEQSGQLGDLMKLAGQHIDEQLEKVIETMNKMLEPALLIIIGGIVMILALALYLPIFQSYSSIG